MTPEVKERIERIRRGNVPEGYVKNKDGIYPEDWTSKKMGQWLQLMERPVKLEDEETYELVTVRRGFGGVNSRGTYLGKSVLVKNYFELHAGDFIISKRQIAHGACGVVPSELDGAVVSNEYNVFVPQKETNINMFNMMMQLSHYKRLFYLMSDGVHIEKLLFKTKDWMRRTIAIPHIDEQKKIVEILDAQDRTIELKEQLLAKKLQLKKYLIQQLLTCKIRVPGFNGVWKKVRFADVGEIISGGTPNTNEPLYWDGNIPWCTPTDITRSGKYIYSSEKNITQKGLDNSSAQLIPEGSILMCSRASIGPRCINRVPMATNQGFKSIICHKELVDTEFIFYLISIYEKEFIQLSSGSTFLELSKSDLENFNIAIPGIDEQKAIAEILSTADKEIELLQQDLEQEKQKKKALMQLLLTGVVRVLP